MKSFLYIFLFAIIFLLYSCKKEGSYFSGQNTIGPDTTSSVFNFINLVASPDTVKVGDVINIYATATGRNLYYTWSTSHGNLFGSGYHVESGADPCCVGRIKVTCTISDSTHTASKDVYYSVTF